MSRPLVTEFRTPFVDKGGQLTAPVQKSLANVVVLEAQKPNAINRPQFTLKVFANNAAAITGGLVAGDLYRTGADPDLIAIVH